MTSNERQRILNLDVNMNEPVIFSLRQCCCVETCNYFLLNNTWTALEFSSMRCVKCRWLSEPVAKGRLWFMLCWCKLYYGDLVASFAFPVLTMNNFSSPVMGYTDGNPARGLTPLTRCNIPTLNLRFTITVGFNDLSIFCCKMYGNCNMATVWHIYNQQTWRTLWWMQLYLVHANSRIPSS